MTTTPTPAPTPAEFLAQPFDLEEDLEHDVIQDFVFTPIESIAESLRKIAASFDVTEVERLRAEVESLTLQLSYEREGNRICQVCVDHEAASGTRQALIDEVLKICKPSTSKLANSIRAVLAPPAEAPVETLAEAGLNQEALEQIVEQPHNHDFRTGETPGTCACGRSI